MIRRVHDLVALGDAEGLARYLESRPDATALVNEADDFDRTPLLLALDRPDPNPAVVRVLLEHGADAGHVQVHKPLELPSGGGLLFKVASWFLKRAFSLIERIETSTLKKALATGNLEIVRMFAERGADLTSVDHDGYSAIQHALGSTAEPVEVVDLLIELGAPLNGVSKYGETAVGRAYSNGWFAVLARLVAAGADESPLAWTPLARACAMGTLADVLTAVADGWPIEARARDDLTVLHIALMRGDGAIVETLLALGASPFALLRGREAAVALAAASGNLALVKLMLGLGCDPKGQDYWGRSALNVALDRSDRDLAELLRAHGAAATEEDLSEALAGAKTPAMVDMLLDWGLPPESLDTEARAIFLGGDEYGDGLAGISLEQYRLDPYARPGRADPEDITNDYRVAMVRSVATAWRARKRFDDEFQYDEGCPVPGVRRPDIPWCFQRFGQSITLLPDGRRILIAGEHEDGYDSDFWIYNDVTVLHPDGRVQVFGYPDDVFEPTDFHTATLWGGCIWIVGGLGYTWQRDGSIPVYRLDPE
ncbi:MAG: hypothetical protein K8L99_17675, partial [Anaerolineae bacterium]|nr:hypothetical protein [Anaerolineae bacterium]